ARAGAVPASSPASSREETRRIVLSVPAIRCGGCIRKIEDALGALEGVESARVNLSTKRVSVVWRADRAAPPLVSTLAGLGYAAHPDEPADALPDRTLSKLIR